MEKGCNVGNAVYAGPTGLFPLTNSPNKEWYNGTRLHIVTWSGDPQCGIKSNVYNFTGKQCLGGPNYLQGNVIEYNSSDINCTNVPIDTGVIFLLGATVLISVWFITKFRKFNNG